MLKKYIELIKERIQLSEVVGRTIKLRKVGSRLIGRCPFHEEKTPSFSVNDSGRFFYCFGCGKSGDVIDFISETKHLNLNDAVEELAASIGIKVEKKGFHASKLVETQDFLEQLKNWFCDNLHSRIGLKAKTYLESRLKKDVITEFQLGYCPSDINSFLKDNSHFQRSMMMESGVLDKSGRCFFKNRIVFPIKNRQGRVIAFGSRTIREDSVPKYINSCETPFFKKSEVFYNLDKAAKVKTDTLVVVEGYMDVISLYQHGYKNVLGVLGTSITPHHLKTLDQLGKRVQFCFDGDTAGIKAARRVIGLVMSEFIEILNIRMDFAFLPANKDPDELVKEDYLAFKRILDNARSLSDTIFYLATYGNSYNSPEDFIALERVLQNYLKNIKDYKVKRHFQDFFRQKIFLMKKGLRISPIKSAGYIGETNSVHTYQDSAKLVSLASVRTDRKAILLKIVLKFPEILQNSEFEEYFSMLKFDDPVHRKLQSAIVQFLNFEAELNSERLKEFLCSNVEGIKLLEAMQNTKLPESVQNKGDVLLLWCKIKEQLWINDLQNEYRNLIQSPDLDEEKMEKATKILEKIRKAST